MPNREGRTGERITGRLRCGFDATLKGERCELPGEARTMGLLLCEKHFRQLEIEDRIALLRGVASSLELCLCNVRIRQNTAFTRLLRSRQREAAAKLESAYRELREYAKDRA